MKRVFDTQGPDAPPAADTNSETQTTAISLQMNQDNIRNVWEFSVSGGEKAYSDWLRRLCRVHLRESPSPSLRACSLLAEKYMVRRSPLLLLGCSPPSF
jgi:hypothetical protein